jgi:hypothetical protein
VFDEDFEQMKQDLVDLDHEEVDNLVEDVLVLNDFQLYHLM